MSHGLYVPATARTDLPEQRILEASARLPSGGAVTGWAACRMHGAAFFDGLDKDGVTRLPVPLALGADGNIRRSSGVALGYERLDPAEAVSAHGVPVTVVVRAGFDEMRRTGDLRDAVVAIDMLAAALLVSIRRMREYAMLCPRRRRCRLVLDALDLASEHSRSPQETRLRLVWVLDARLTPDVLVNCSIFDRRGNFLAIADLLDVEAGLVVEYDGADHRRATRQSSDLGREDLLRRHRLEVARFNGPDLQDTNLVVERLHAARARAHFEPPESRTWVVRPAVDVLDSLLDHMGRMPPPR